MYRDHNRLLIVSGLLSFLLFGLILLLIIWQFINSDKPLAFASIQSDVISVSLAPSPSKGQKSETLDELIPPREELEQPTPKPEKVSTNNEAKPAGPEITDLFSNIKTKKVTQKSKDNREKISDLNEFEQKILSSQRDSTFFEKVKGLELAKSGVKVLAASSGPKVNEYYAKVQGIIYENFHPASGTEGFSARVRIVLTSDGRLDSYRVVSSSGNSVFNSEVDWLKERLRQVSLPKNPNGSEATFEIILTAKD